LTWLVVGHPASVVGG